MKTYWSPTEAFEWGWYARAALVRGNTTQCREIVRKLKNAGPLGDRPLNSLFREGWNKHARTN